MGCGCQENKSSNSKPNVFASGSTNQGNYVKNAVDPINPLSPNDLVLDTIKLSFDDNYSLQNYITNLNIPLVIQYLLENKYVVISNALTIVLEIPVSQLPITKSSGNKNLRPEGQELLELIGKKFNLSQTDILKILNTFDQPTKSTIYNTIQRYILCKRKNDKNNSRKYELIILNLFSQKYKCIPIPEKTVTFTIGEQGVKNIAKLNYFLSVSKYIRPDNISIDIPSYVKNWYELQMWARYIQDNNLIPNSLDESSLIKRPVFYNNCGTSVIFKDLKTVLEVDYLKYLKTYELEGTIGSNLKGPIGTNLKSVC
jgi:hypothetical protein